MTENKLNGLNSVIEDWKSPAPKDSQAHIWYRLSNSLDKLEERATSSFKIHRIPAFGLAVALVLMIFFKGHTIHQKQERVALNKYVMELANGTIASDMMLIESHPISEVF